MARRVSVLMLCYNKLEYTRRCVVALRQNTDPALYELVAIDNASSDGTPDFIRGLVDELPGTIPVLNSENLHFVRGNNRGAEVATAEYLLFLNNDTEVQPGWLEPMVALMERDSRVGVAGSQLIYPDGRLQEAGGLVFSDGSAWNFGRLEDPDDPEYEYVREVDYCSGAALMVRADLFRSVGGFDTLYAPIYYEDTDLCFAARRRGYRVMYQPSSRVVHHEGVTCGTDVSTGLKRYQEINHAKFVEKWKRELAGQPARPRDMKEARHVSDRRCRGGKRVFIGTDALADGGGGRHEWALFALVRSLLDSGHHVTVASSRPTVPAAGDPARLVGDLRDAGALVLALEVFGSGRLGSSLEEVVVRGLARRDYDVALCWSRGQARWLTEIIQSQSPSTPIFESTGSSADLPPYLPLQDVAFAGQGSSPVPATPKPLRAADPPPRLDAGLLGVTMGEGLHKDEGGWCWMDRSAEVFVWSDSLDTPKQLVVDLSCHDASVYPTFPFDVGFHHDGGLLCQATFTQSHQRQTVYVPLRRSPTDLRVTIQSAAAFTPALSGLGDDQRTLAVRVHRLRLLPEGVSDGDAIPDRVTWQCNICGSFSTSALWELKREQPTCAGCGSTVRFRSVVHVLSMELFGRSLILADFPVDRRIRGIGLSDWEGHAVRLRSKLDYTNTYYHQAPRLDILDIEPAMVGRLDFLISSEVFEHVPPPVSRAFVNARRLLKRGGLLVLTVPYGLQEDTIEHFPELHRYEIVQQYGKRVLKNVTSDGREQVFHDLVFHGGPGVTLEMRVFSRRCLERELATAGFGDVKVWLEPHLPFGIFWLEQWSAPITAWATAEPGVAQGSPP